MTSDTGERALRRWFEEKRVALTTQVSSLEAERNRILNELKDIDSILERERFRVEIVDEFAAEVGAIISDRVSPDMEMVPTPTDAVTASVESEPGITRAETLDRLAGRVKSSSDDPKRVLSAAVGRTKKAKKVQEIVQEIVEQVEGSDDST